MNDLIRDEWTQEYFNGNYSNLKSDEILGNVDARDEWGSNKKPEEVFIHIKSYKSFIKKSTLFLYGRRGTGKTALIRMLCYEIEENKIKDYQYCSLIDSETSYSNLSVQIQLGPYIKLEFKDLIIELKNKWLWVIETSAMQTIIKKHHKLIDKNNDLKAIISFLESESISPLSKRRKNDVLNPMKRLSEIIAEEFGKISDDKIQIGVALYKLTRRCFSSDYRTAQRSLYNFLIKNKETCLVIIDSIEPYSSDNVVFKALTASLIETSLDLHAENNNYGVLCKTAFPAEMEPHIKPLNPGKADPKSVFIRWGYADLVSMLAKRYLKLTTKTHNKKEYEKYEDPLKARQYLYQFMPSQMRTKVINDFDTLANIIRHTQKKPRQILYLMNTILTLAKSKNISFSELDEETISSGIHARLDMPVKSVTDMYSHIYPECLKIIYSILVDKENIMSMAELDQYLPSASNVVGGRLANYEVKRLLFEVGVLGTVRRKSNFEKNKQILESLFEYQVKGLLPYNERSRIAVHPMFYTNLQTKVSLNQFIYPVPGEETETEVLKELGINLL